MEFDEFLKAVSSKIGPANAFNLAKDVQIETIKNLLIKKGIFSQDEYDVENANQFKNLAEQLLNLPPIPGSNDNGK